MDLLDQRGSRGDPPPDLEGGKRKILEDLARALSRLAQYSEALPLWEEAYRLAEEEGAWEEAGECRRRIGIIEAYRGDPGAAVAEYDRVLAFPPDRLSPELIARVRLRRGVALEEMGSLEEARTELENVLEMAEGLEDPLILAQAHRALVLLHIWTGHPDRVREHGQRAMELAKAAGSLSVEFWTHWGLAVLEGLLGHTGVMAEHVQEANRVARELRSPILKLRSAELAIEEAAATGRWNSGVIIGEQAIALARSLSQNTILPRLQVWTALIYLGQGEVELARPLVEEAWEVARAGTPGTANVHAEIPAYIGRGYLALREEKWDEAIRIGKEALEIADEVGYGLWAIHRLVPLLGEAYLFKGDLEGAREVAQRLKSGSSPIQHKLGLAWGRSCEALITWMEGNAEEGAAMMEEAAVALEEIPMIGDAARLRRLKASGLAESGDRKGALDELHKVHEIFLTLGAEVELEKTRDKFRELDARPPRRAAVGEGELSPRELEIARLVEGRKSNKAIAKELSISPRTVSTHLSNVYQKLGISSRGELADYVREEGLVEW
jgi:DNA-binding CsgD family transcriptional regulator/Tfp pilus assembly protein PilF